MRISTLVATALALTMLQGANAAVISTGAPDTEIYSFGDPDTTSYGEVFKAPGGSLSSWSFYVNGPTGAFDLVIADWDGSKAVGPALYTASSGSASTSAAPLGETKFTWSGINLGLTASEDYIAYITTADVSGPTTQVGVGGTSSDTYADGGFYFLNSSGVDPLTLNNDWSSWDIPDMAFDATFVDAEVPEPATLTIWTLGALGCAAAAYRRRKAG